MRQRASSTLPAMAQVDAVELTRRSRRPEPESGPSVVALADKSAVLGRT